MNRGDDLSGDQTGRQGEDRAGRLLGVGRQIGNARFRVKKIVTLPEYICGVQVQKLYTNRSGFVKTPDIRVCFGYLSGTPPMGAMDLRVGCDGR